MSPEQRVRRQRLRELIGARDALDKAIVALGGIPHPGPKMPRHPGAQHGTESGYSAHRRQSRGWDKEACHPCRRAHAEYMRKRRLESTERG